MGVKVWKHSMLSSHIVVAKKDPLQVQLPAGLDWCAWGDGHLVDEAFPFLDVVGLMGWEGRKVTNSKCWVMFVVYWHCDAVCGVVMGCDDG